MKYRQQTYYQTDYYLSCPKGVANFINSIGGLHRIPLGVIADQCPFYAPIVPNGCCRLCHKKPENHRKYFIYSVMASKIQRKYFKYKFKKFYKENYHLFNRPSCSNLPLPAKVFKYKILYYRRWSKYSLEMYLRKN